MRRLTFLLIVSVLAHRVRPRLGGGTGSSGGREIDLAAFESKLRAGMSAGEIEETFGPPFQREEVRGGEEWRYLEVRTLRVCRPFVLFIPLGRHPSGGRRSVSRWGRPASNPPGSTWIGERMGPPIRRSLLTGPTAPE